jgi:PAS domain S-box-containing protein
MDLPLGDPAEEIKRLQLCNNNLVSALALPALWSGGGPSDILRTLVDVLLSLLSLDLIHVELSDLGGGASSGSEMTRVAQSQELPADALPLRDVLSPWLGESPEKWPPKVKNPFGDGHLAIMSLQLGLQGELGLIVAGSQREHFPTQAEKLVLGVAANQAVIGLQEARRRSEQKRVADELDRRVAQRTIDLAAANEELKREVVERRHAEERLRHEERELKHSEARKTAILNSALDCIVTMDHEGGITEFNPAAERTFGYRRDEIIGKSMAEVIIPPSFREHHRLGVARYLATGESRVLGRHLELTAVRADGSEFPVELAITRIPLDGPPSFTGYLRDITDRKRSQDDLRRSEAFLAEAQRLSLTGSFSLQVSTGKVTCSEELYRIFAFDPEVPVTLEHIGDRVHP